LNTQLDLSPKHLTKTKLIMQNPTEINPSCSISNSNNTSANQDKSPEDLAFDYIQTEQFDNLKKLVEEGLSLDLVNARGYHTVHIVAINGSAELLEYILEQLRKENADIVDIVNYPDWSKLRPIHFAASEGWTEVLQMLLDAGADPTLVNDDAVSYLSVGFRVPLYVTGGKTPLHFAAERGEEEAVKLLQQSKYGAQLKQVKDMDGNTPYNLALLHKRTECAKLLRSSEDDVLELPKELLDQLKASQQKERAARITQKEKQQEQLKVLRIKNQYLPKHLDLFDMDSIHSKLDKNFLAAIQDGSEAALRSLLKEEAPRIYSFNLFSPELCQKLIEECEHYEKSGLPVTRPNSMNNYGLILNEIGFHGLMTELMNKCVAPFAKFLFKDFGGDSLDSHHAFVVRYKIGEDLDLSTHVDDSEVTLNVCLGKEFGGGTLFFEGIEYPNAKQEDRTTQKFEYTHSLGRAVLHTGKHTHGANALTSGERINLILWCRSSYYRTTILPAFSMLPE